MKTFLMKMCSLLLFTTTGCCNSTPAVVMEKNALLIDVRTPEEFRSGAIPGALNMPHDRIGETIASAAPDKKTPLYLYCRSGMLRRFQDPKFDENEVSGALTGINVDDYVSGADLKDITSLLF